MIKDPFTVWNGAFPYDVLAPVGVTPALSHSALQEAAFDLMAQGLMNPETQRAWDELHRIPRRLMIDLLLYDVDPADDTDAAREEVEYELRHPGEPAEVAEALTLAPALVGELADELGEIVLHPPEDVACVELDTLARSDLLDQLIRFDR